MIYSHACVPERLFIVEMGRVQTVNDSKAFKSLKETFPRMEIMPKPVLSRLFSAYLTHSIILSFSWLQVTF